MDVRKGAGGDELSNKYGARKVELDGHTFDSQAEARRYGELKLMEQAGEIENLRVHPKFELQKALLRNGKTIRPITYTADFAYYDHGLPHPGHVVEDVKGGKATQTAAFRIKQKLFMAKYPHCEFRIVEA